MKQITIHIRPLMKTFYGRHVFIFACLVIFSFFWYGFGVFLDVERRVMTALISHSKRKVWNKYSFLK